MRNFAVVACLLFALAARGETFGPVTVEARPGLGLYRDGTYFEHRFTAFNPTSEPHSVRVDVAANNAYDRGKAHASRTVVVAPRSSTIISVPQYVTTHYGGIATDVYVDGNLEGRLESAASYAATDGRRDLLVGRSVPAETAMLLAPEDSGVNAVRPSVAPSSWSSNWLHYAGLSAAALTPADWNELPRPVQTALLRWVAAGGALVFIGGEPPGLPPVRPAAFVEPYRAGHYGFGTLGLLPGKFDPAPVLATVQRTWHTPALEAFYPFGGTQGQARLPMPLVDDKLPVKSLFSLLLFFALVGGPVNIWVLAKKERRLWIFWTLPLLAIVTAVILVGSVILGEGWLRVQKSSSLTLLDERIGEAVTLGWTGIYSTLAPDGEIRFDSGSEVRPLFVMTDARTDWTDGQRFVSGWVGSRLPRGFAIRKVEPRRERLPVRREGGQLIAVNGLGAAIDELRVADDTGAIFIARNVPAGKEVVLTPAGSHVSANVADPVAALFAGPTVWSTYYSRVSANPNQILQPNTYVAVVQRSPFVEAALAKPTKTTSEAVIVGVMKGIDHAS